MAAGAVLMGAGLILTARVHYFPLLFLTYGLGAGGAVACVYVPSIAAVGEWFKLRRDIALGVAISGIGCGTLVSAPVAAMLIGRYGWPATFEIFGIVSAALLLLCTTLIASPPIATSKVRIGVMAKIRTPAFGFSMLRSSFLASLSTSHLFISQSMRLRMAQVRLVPRGLSGTSARPAMLDAWD